MNKKDKNTAAEPQAQTSVSPPSPVPAPEKTPNTEHVKKSKRSFFDLFRKKPSEEEQPAPKQPRFFADTQTGLTGAQVEERKEKGLVNTQVNGIPKRTRVLFWGISSLSSISCV